MSPRSTAAEARRTRDSIIGRSIEIASADGLEGITIGRLASDLQMSKAGVLGHFGTKEDLQLSTLHAAIDIFRREVWEPAADVTPGLARLKAICDHWISYLERRVFPGGCFLTAVSCEFDDRPGPIHDAIARALKIWLRALRDEAQTAIDDGDLPPRTDAAAIAFQLNALAMGANQALQLLDDAHATRLAHRAMHDMLRPV